MTIFLEIVIGRRVGRAILLLADSIAASLGDVGSPLTENRCRLFSVFTRHSDGRRRENIRVVEDDEGAVDDRFNAFRFQGSGNRRCFVRVSAVD